MRGKLGVDDARVYGVLYLLWGMGLKGLWDRVLTLEVRGFFRGFEEKAFYVLSRHTPIPSRFPFPGLHSPKKIDTSSRALALLSPLALSGNQPP